MRISEVILGELQREGEATARILERVPPGKLDWRPHEKSRSVGDLAYHIAALPALAAMVLRNSELDPSKARPAVPRDVPAAAVYQRNLDEFRSVIGPMDDQQMMQPFRFVLGDKVIMDAPRAAMLRTLFLNHSYHHRGQLSVYLRLLDVPLPVIYGPTADEGI